MNQFMNLFEQQAKALAAVPRSEKVKPLTKLEPYHELAKNLDLEDCAELTRALADRVTKLCGLPCALDDAAEQIAEAAKGPCECGQCDDCQAALADDLYSKRKDKAMEELK